MMFIFLIILGLLVFYMVNPQKFKEIFKGDGYSNDPLKILKERFARGEISKEEYENMKADLEK